MVNPLSLVSPSNWPHARPPSISEQQLVCLDTFEASLWPDPAAALVPGPVKSCADPRLAGYLRDLSSSLTLVAGLGGTWHPGLVAGLTGLAWDSISGAKGFVMLGTCAEHRRVNQALGPTHQGDCQVAITGVRHPRQLEQVRAAVKELSEKTGTRAMTVLRSVNLRTSLGTLPDGSAVLGLAGGGTAVSLLASLCFDLDSTRGVLFHEVGHLVDAALSPAGFRSEQPDTPFGKTSSPADYPSPEVVGNAAEDFADCHAQLILDWKAIEADPDLMVHARGRLGGKLAWIREHAYRQPVPPPSARLLAIRGEVAGGATPFDGLDKFHEAVNSWLYGRSLPAQQAGWLESRFRRNLSSAD
ncbi:MAG: hypothetical protein AB7S38_27345 [Vulcanimicrobiota bacterium]